MKPNGIRDIVLFVTGMTYGTLAVAMDRHGVVFWLDALLAGSMLVLASTLADGLIWIFCREVKE